MIYLTEKERIHKESLLAKHKRRWVRLYRRRISLSDDYWRILDRILVEKSMVLDPGAGKKGMLSLFKGRHIVTVGLDLSYEDLKENQNLTFRVCGDAQYLPFKSNCFDVIVSQWLLEHLSVPGLFIMESSRILRNHGNVLLVSNSLFCPLMFFNAIMPAKLRDWLKQQFLPREVEEDTFPTYYRANTHNQLKRKTRKAGLKELYFNCLSDLSFFVFNRVFFAFWLRFDQLTDNRVLKLFRMHIIGLYKKECERATL
jgi:SAM-dependent methyltransferase